MMIVGVLSFIHLNFNRVEIFKYCVEIHYIFVFCRILDCGCYLLLSCFIVLCFITVFLFSVVVEGVGGEEEKKRRRGRRPAAALVGGLTR